jgi:hypothetical protein
MVDSDVAAEGPRIRSEEMALDGKPSALCAQAASSAAMPAVRKRDGEPARDAWQSWPLSHLQASRAAGAATGARAWELHLLLCHLTVLLFQAAVASWVWSLHWCGTKMACRLDRMKLLAAADAQETGAGSPGEVA